ncbi:AMP-binding protein, partial [Acinetobacter baumannii]|uniref:AMP-binding protein n=1 Tax=Acinetobacter baumannii TaxID=470 RepID=UPI0013CFE262
MKTVPDLCRRRAELTPDAIAFAELATGRSWTFADVDDRAERAATLFEAMGLGEGDRVAVLCHNT